MDIKQPDGSIDVLTVSASGSPYVYTVAPDETGDYTILAVRMLNYPFCEDDAVNITKRIHVSENSNQELQLLGNIKAGDYFRIAIKDDGPGIPEEIQTQIFEPFFSTKPQGHGLGLAAVLGILNTHQGEIILNSKNGEGTEFKVYLPVFQSEQSFQEEIQLHANSNSKFILLVDDDSEILKSTSEILEHAGNRVIVAKDGSAAIDAYKNSKEDFNILITDIKMPKMDGVTLARKLREQEPTLPVILTTGYDDVSDKLTSTETLGYEFIRKPYRADEILKAIDHLSGRS